MEAMESLAEEDRQLEHLGDDVLAKIWSYLDSSSLALCACVNTDLMRTINEDQIAWRRCFEADFAVAGTKSRLSSNDNGGSAIELRASVQAKVEDAQRLLGLEGATTDWRMLYRRRCEVDQRWSRGISSSRVLRGHTDLIRCAQLEGSTLVTASGSMSHTDCTLRVWDLDTGMLRQLLRGHMGPISCMVYDPASGRIASGSEDYTVRYWDSQAGSCVSLMDPESSVRCIHMDQSSHQLVAGTEFGRLLLWDTQVLDDLLSSGLKRIRMEFERIHVTPSQGNSGGSRRVVVDSNNRAMVLDSAEGEGKAITSIQVQGGLCATTSVEPQSTIMLWDVANASSSIMLEGGWSPIRTLGDPESMIFASSMSFEKPLNRLVAGCGDRAMRLWDLETGSLLHCLEGHSSQVTCHQFDERMLASASQGGTLLTWDLRLGQAKPVHCLDHGGSSVPVFQYDGSRLASGTADGRTLLWDLTTGRKITEWRGTEDDRISALAMDDYRLVSAGNNNSIYVSSFLPSDNPEDEEMGVGSSSSNAVGCTPMDHDASTSSARGYDKTRSSSMRSSSPPDEGSSGEREGDGQGSSSPSSGNQMTRAGPLGGGSGLLSPDGPSRRVSEGS